MSKKSNQKTQTNKQSINWSVGSGEKRNFSTNWYIGMALGFLGMIALAIFLIESWTFVALLVVAAIALVVFIKKPNQIIHYSLNPEFISIDGREHSINDFKAFAVVKNFRHGHRLILIPVKRLAPALELDFEDDLGEIIVDFFGERLPMKELQTNFIDNIIQRLGL